MPTGFWMDGNMFVGSQIEEILQEEYNALYSVSLSEGGL